MDKLSVKARRPSQNKGDGVSLVVDHPYWDQKSTLEAINHVFKTNFIPREQFIVTVKKFPDDGSLYKFLGYCNTSRGDFYMEDDVWFANGCPDFKLSKNKTNYHIVSVSL